MRVRFTKDIWDGDGSDTPRGIIAPRHTPGELVVGPDNPHWPAYVKIASGVVIGCTFDEYEIWQGHLDCPDCGGVGLVGTDGEACCCVRMKGGG